MLAGESIFERVFVRRALAVLASAILFFFAAGGTFLHQHTTGPDTPCHICQSLHLPALAVASLDLVAAPQLIARYASLPMQATPSKSFSLHRAGRAPPTA
jgi:hypothetical protein